MTKTAQLGERLSQLLSILEVKTCDLTEPELSTLKVLDKEVLIKKEQVVDIMKRATIEHNMHRSTQALINDTSRDDSHSEHHDSSYQDNDYGNSIFDTLQLDELSASAPSEKQLLLESEQEEAKPQHEHKQGEIGYDDLMAEYSPSG
jgi:hypothetical protein